MLKLENINITFNKNTANERKALQHIDLDVADGDFVTVIGSNGAGKSTLMNVISGSYEADTGKIFLDGKNITHLKEHQRARTIGRLFQDPLRGTAPNMTIEENLGLAYSRGKRRSLTIGIRKKDVSVFRERLKELDLGLEDRMKMPVGLLSGGQRQALTLLMATIVTPKLLLLDEHTAALDPKTAEKVMRITEKIVKENALTTLMITHNISNAIEYGNKTIVMSQGKLLLTIEGEQRANHDGGKAYEALFRHRRGRTFRQDDTSRIIRHTKSCGVFPPQLLLLFFHIRLNIYYIYSCDLRSALYDKDLFFFIISSVRLVYSAKNTVGLHLYAPVLRDIKLHSAAKHINIQLDFVSCHIGRIKVHLHTAVTAAYVNSFQHL